jgi:hypothetical protein
MATAAVIARILTQYSDKGTKAAQKDIARLEKKISAFGKKAVKSFALAGAATAAFAVKLSVDAVKGAAADEKQQAALAVALRNTTGATDAAIAANIEYLDSLELQVAIDNKELIPALQKLVTATGDLGQAQELLSLATDVSAASGKDLGSVTTALSRAIGGNFTALTKLGLPLDKAAVKAKDFEKIQKDLARVSRGQASAAANTFSGKLETLQLSFNQVSDKLGLALMPALEILVKYIDTDVIPMLDVWINKNKYELNDALQSSVGSIKEVVTAFQDIYKVIQGVNAILPFGLGGWLKLIVAINAFSAAAGIAMMAAKKFKDLKMMAGLTRGSTVAYKDLTAQLGFFRGTQAKVISGFQGISRWAAKSKGLIAFLTRGFIALSKAIFMTPWGRLALVIGAVGYGIFKLAKQFNWFGMSNKKAGDSAEELQKRLEKLGKRANEHSSRMIDNAIKQAKITADIKKKNDAQLAKEEMAAKRKAAIEARTAAVKKRIASMTDGRVKITEADEYDLIQLTAVELLQKKQKEVDKSLAERISLRKEELTLFNSLTAKTAQYLDFLKAINSDGKLDDSELVKLMSKWNLTQTAASKYADFVYAIGDRKLSDIEIENLKNKWGLTTKQVVDYLAKIGAPVDAKGTALSAGDIAALGWKNASSALDAYNAKLKGAVITPPPPPTMNPPIPGGVQELIDREMAIDKPFMPGDFGYLGIPKSPAPAPLTGSSLYGGGIDYSRLFSSSTLDNGMSLMSDAFSSSGGTTNINLAVYGSVTSEQDLVQTIRQGLLQGQSSGYGLLLQEI